MNSKNRIDRLTDWPIHGPKLPWVFPSLCHFRSAFVPQSYLLRPNQRTDQCAASSRQHPRRSDKKDRKTHIIIAQWCINAWWHTASRCNKMAVFQALYTDDSKWKCQTQGHEQLGKSSAWFITWCIDMTVINLIFGKLAHCMERAYEKLKDLNFLHKCMV